MAIETGRIILFLSAIFLAGSSVICPSSPEGKNILFITLDTTRADHIGCYNERLRFTPHIDRLGNEGVIYLNCYSNVPLTLPSHASIFTGKHPLKIDVRNNGRYMLTNEHESITEILKKRGFSTFAVISSYVLSSKFGLSQGFDLYDDSLDVSAMTTSLSSEITADKVFNKFRIILDKFENKKFFGWLHFYDPHIPYSPPGEFAEKFEKDPYLGEIAFVDMVIGKITGLLKQKGLLMNTTIIIAGDHGEDKGEHREFGHGIFCYDNTLRVPLIIWNGDGLPGGKKVRTLVKLTDIFEVVSELSGQKNSEGKSLLIRSAAGTVDKDRDLYFESLYAKEEMGWSPLTGIISGGFKYISLPVPELYDLVNDPEEKRNIFEKKKDLARELDSKLGRFYTGNSGIKKSGERELSEKDRAHLETLGYISSFKRSKNEIDPKEGVRYLDRLRDIRAAVSQGELSSAERDLRKLFFSKDRIDSIHAYEIFDALYRKKKDLKNLIKFHELAVRDFPQSREFLNLLAQSYFTANRLDDAESTCRSLLSLNSTSTQALVMLGKISMSRGKLQEALEFFQKAAGIEPKNYGIKRNIAFVLARMGRKSEAMEILDSVSGDPDIRKNPDNIDLLVGISMQLFNSGAGREALQLLNGLNALHPGNPPVLVSLGTLHSRMRKHEEGLKYLSGAMAADPGYADAYNKAGIVNLMMFMEKRDRSNLVKAETLFSKAVSLDPGMAESYSGRGTVKVFLNKPDSAIKDLEKALELDPGILDVYFNLGILYLRQGEKGKAGDLFIKCRDLFSGTLSPDQKKRLDGLIAESGR